MLNVSPKVRHGLVIPGGIGIVSRNVFDRSSDHFPQILISKPGRVLVKLFGQCWSIRGQRRIKTAWINFVGTIDGLISFWTKDKMLIVQPRQMRIFRLLRDDKRTT